MPATGSQREGEGREGVAEVGGGGGAQGKAVAEVGAALGVLADRGGINDLSGVGYLVPKRILTGMNHNHVTK